MSSCEAVEYAARTYGVGSLESMNDAPGISKTYNIMSEESRDQKWKREGLEINRSLRYVDLFLYRLVFDQRSWILNAK
jgi:hypothetical protein